MSGNFSPSPQFELEVLSTIALVTVFVFVWIPAHNSAQTWAESLDLVEGRLSQTDAFEVAWTSTRVLFNMWVWLIVIVLLLLTLQHYLVSVLRKAGPQGKSSVSKHGTLLSISFGVVAKASVLLCLSTSVILTFLFAWVSMTRVLAKHPHETTDRRVKAIKLALSQSMLFNLVLVIVTLAVSGTLLA